MGVAFKGYPITDDLRGSMAIELIKLLKTKFVKSKIYGFDPVVDSNKLKEKNIIPLKSIIQSFSKTDIIIIANNNNHFSKLNLEKLSKLMNKNSIIYDVWNLYEKDKLNLKNNVRYFSLGNQAKSKKFKHR